MEGVPNPVFDVCVRISFMKQYRLIVFFLLCFQDGSTDDREILDKDNAAFANQRRMNADPLEIMLLNMGYRLPGVLEQMPEDLESRPGSDRNIVQCRTS